MNRLLRVFPLLTALGLFAALGAVSCGKSPLLAPTGTVINLTVTSDAAALNSSVDIIAVLIENGQQSGGTGTGTASTGSSTTGAGTPVQNGTVVSFTTSIGTIEPAEAKTENGKVSVKLKTNGESGTATITAYSGGAKSTAQIKVGAANAKTITVTATPQNLPATGGSAIVSAKVDDGSGNGITGIPVLFTTTKGTLSAASVISGAGGTASTTLTTTSAAEVTATAGALAGVKVAVGVSARSTVAVALTSSTGLAQSSPIVFSVTPSVGAGSSLSNVTINYGDGQTKALGSITGATSVTHFYSSTGIFDVSVTGTDIDGVVSTAATQVAIGGLSGSVASTGSGHTAAAVFTVTMDPTSAVISEYEWDFGDGTANVSSASRSQSHVYALVGTYTVTVRITPTYRSSSNPYITLIYQIVVT